MKRIKLKAFLASLMALLMLINIIPASVFADTSSEPEKWYTKSELTIDKHILFGEDRMYTEGKANRGFDYLIDGNASAVFYVSTADTAVNYQDLAGNGKEISLTVHTEKPVVIDHFKIVAGADTYKANYAHRNPTGWTLKAGNSADSCDTVLVADEPIDASSGYKPNVYTFENTTPYQYYEFTITSLAGAGRSGHDSPFSNPTATCTLADIAFGGPEPISHTDHDDISFTKWKSTNSLPTTAGNYFLDNDVTISNTWNVPSGTTNLCLNGHGIKKTGNGRAITVNGGANLNIYDCGNTTHYFDVTDHLATNINDTSGTQSFTGGYITGGNANGGDTENQRGGGIFVYSGGNFTMNGGALIGNKSTNIGAAICSSPLNVSNNTSVITLNAGSKIMYNATPTNAAGGIYASGNVNLNGVQITNNYAGSNQIGGVNFNGKGTVTVSGATVVKDNYSGDKESNFGIEKTLQLGELTDGAYISMYSTSSYYGVNDGGAFTTENGKDYIDCFHVDSSRSDTYILGTTADGAIKMGKKFTVTWNDSDNSNLKTDELFKNDIPSYEGDTPEKLQDEFYTYTFAGWYDGTNTYGINDTLPSVTENITYTALYTQTSAHNHNDATFEAWTKTDSLPTAAGNYVLANDITISSTWNVPSGTTNLCLNGHGIKMTGNSSVMTVSAGATLKIYDCDTETEHRFSVSNKKSNGAGFATVNDSLTSGYETFTGGYITGGKGTRVNNWSRGGAFYISGAVEMYGGTVIGNGQYGTTHGGGFSTIESGTFKMYGGSIQNNAGQCGGATRLQGAVCEILGGKIINNVVSADGGGIHVGGTIPVILKDCEISGNYAENGPGAGIWMTTTGTEVSGSTVIENNLTSKGVSNIELGNGYTIAVGTLNNDAKIGIKMNNGTGVFTSGWNTHMSGKDPAAYFTSDNSSYGVILGSNSEAEIGVPPVASITSGSSTTEYTSIADAISNWSTGSTLKLLKDVTTSTTINVPSGEHTLDLNGHGIKMTGNNSVFTVSDGAKLKVTDSNTETVHKFSVSGKKSNGAGFATVNDSLTSGYDTFTGGYITGGTGTSVSSWNEGGAFYITGAVEMYGGTVIGNGQLSTTHGGAFVTRDSGTFKMYGGTIRNNAGQCGGATRLKGGSCEILGGKIINNIASADGAGIHVGGSIPVILKDCEISGNYANNGPGAGIWMTNTGTVVSGKTVIQNNLTGSGTSNIEVGNGLVFSVGELTEGAKIGVKMNGNPGVFTSGWKTNMSGKDPAEYFTSDNSNYSVRTLKNGEAYLGPPHTHSWSYTASENTLSATCDGYESGLCNLDIQTITVNASGKVYDGTAVTATLTKSDGWTSGNGLSDPEITYSGNTDAGTYTASITAGTATASKQFTITEKSMASEVSSTNYSGDYDGKSHSITVTAPSGATIKYGTVSGSYTLDKNPTYTNAGTYTVYYQVSKKNYITVTGSATVTIGKINAVVTIEGNYNTADYDGSQHTVSGYTATADTELYDVDKDFTFSGEATASRTNVGTSDMGLAADQFTNTNNNFDTVTFTVTDGFQRIVSVDAVITTSPADASPIYNGSNLKLVTAGEADGGTLYYALGKDQKTAPSDSSYSTEIPTAKSTGSYYVWYKVEADENHNSLQPLCIKVILAEEKWSKLNGTVYLSDGETPAEDATVTLFKGSKKIDYEITKNNGKYRFIVPAGIYNIVVEYQDHIETILVKTTGDTEQDVVMLGGTTDSQLTVNGDDSFGVAVGGLNEEALSIRTRDGIADEKKVSVLMTVEAKTGETAKNASSFSTLSRRNSFMFFDVTVEKTVDSAKEVLNSTSNIIEIVVPYEKINRRGLAVYYSDGSSPKKFEESSSKEDGTFRIDKENGFIYIYSTQFATFAIGYTPHYRVNSSMTLGSFKGKVSVTVVGQDDEGTYKLENVSFDKVSFDDLPKGTYDMTITWTDGAENTITMPFTVS